VLTLPLVKVKDKFQITLPAAIREQLRLAVGDLLEATIEGQTIVLTPQDVVDRTHARQQLIAVMDRVHAKLPPSIQDPTEEEEEIAREIKAHRREHAQRRR
jgi:AbrB family looped-hinge helix DNA binding protein